MTERRKVFECPIHGLTETPGDYVLNVPTCPVFHGPDERCCLDLAGPFDVVLSGSGEGDTP